MKKLFILSLFFVAFSVSAYAQEISFENLKTANVIDYGDVAKGANGNKTIVIKNTGKAPLILSDVHPSCGCTVSSFDKSPILPGKESEIKVSYNTNIVGAINKTITVTSNDLTTPTIILRLKGRVLEPAAEVASK